MPDLGDLMDGAGASNVGSSLSPMHPVLHVHGSVALGLSEDFFSSKCPDDQAG